MSGLIAIGAAVLKIVGLNPQRVTNSIEARAPGRATFGGMDYQLTGVGDEVTTLEVETVPHVMGGLDAWGWIRLHLEEQDVVPLIRLSANYLGSVDGMVTIRSAESDEDRFHPFTGVGRKFRGTVELLHVGF